MNNILRTMVTLNANMAAISTYMGDNIYWSPWICLVDGPRHTPSEQPLQKQ